jgi:hypothetical protein
MSIRYHIIAVSAEHPQSIITLSLLTADTDTGAAPRQRSKRLDAKVGWSFPESGS